MAAHQSDGRLHRAFSVFVFRGNGRELLIQQRSGQKPLFALKWANTCCSHPQQDEVVAKAGRRRLQEELGFSCPLTQHSSFVYQARDPQTGLSEYEFDTILTGEVEDDVALTPDPDEVADVEWKSIVDIRAELQQTPDKYAPWFPIALARVCP